MKEKLIDAFRKCFDHVYCNTCEYDLDNEICEYCHRKNMNWKISNGAADELAEIVISIMEEEK